MQNKVLLTIYLAIKALWLDLDWQGNRLSEKCSCDVSKLGRRCQINLNLLCTWLKSLLSYLNCKSNLLGEYTNSKQIDLSHQFPNYDSLCHQNNLRVSLWILLFPFVRIWQIYYFPFNNLVNRAFLWLGRLDGTHDRPSLNVTNYSRNRITRYQSVPKEIDVIHN